MTDTPHDTSDAPQDTPDELQRLTEQLRRCQADFDNYRKRSDKERADLWQLATMDTLLKLAPIVDTFRRALAQSDDSAAWRTGIEQIQKQLEDLLRTNQLERIEVVGAPFNPAEHEAMSQLPDDTVPADHVSQEVEAGYRYRDTIVKPAKVVVSTGKPAAA